MAIAVGRDDNQQISPPDFDTMTEETGWIQGLMFCCNGEKSA